jgi:transmembrane 9 superfamily protein 2/4
MELSEERDNLVSFTYSVKWVDDPMSWGTRWDHYLHVYDPQIHWISIVNSICIVVILSTVLFVILVRALHRDIARYSITGNSEDGAIDEFGWKLVHADVFRPPSHKFVLIVINV